MKLFLALLGVTLLLAGCVAQQSSPPTATPSVQASPEPTALTTPMPDQTNEEAEATQPSATASVSVQAPSSAPQVKEFSITASQFEFNPSTITVNKGDVVKLKLKSVDVTHSFSLLEFSINEELNQGEEVEVGFTADKAGEFRFFCAIYCGSGHTDMEGQLIVIG